MSVPPCKPQKNTRPLPVAATLLALFLAGVASASTPEDLFYRYGKYQVIAALTELTNDYGFTIQTNNERYYTNSADPRYITAETIAIDMKRHGISSEQLEAALMARQGTQVSPTRGRDSTSGPSVDPLAPSSPSTAEGRADGSSGEPEETATKPVNPACGVERSKASSDRLDTLQAQFPTSYSLHKTLLEKNMADYDYICSLESSPKGDPLLSQLFDQYYPNYSAIRMLYDKNIEALKELER